MKIIHPPHSVLTNPSKPVKKIDSKLKKLVADMTHTLISHRDPEGVGLAAPQVGVGLQLFIIKKNKKTPTKVFINPKIISKTARSTLEITKLRQKANQNDKLEEEPTKLEGCLSIPRIWGKVTRSKKLTVEYTTLNNSKKIEEFSGFEATIIEHEMDHLAGILFTKRVLEQKNTLYLEKDGELTRYEI